MYTFDYSQGLLHTSQTVREHDRKAIERSIELLQIAREKGERSREAGEALFHLRRLWAILIEDLGNPNNDLPDGLRHDLISIGTWMMRKAENIEKGKSSNIQYLIDASSIVLAGFKSSPADRPGA